MRLLPQQVRALGEDGFVILRDRFKPDEIDAVNRRLPHVWQESVEANIREEESGRVRLALALHKRDDLFARLTIDSRLVAPAQQVLREPFYIQQTKVNNKAVVTEDGGYWHHAFANHRIKDGVPQPLALNIHVFLDDVTPFNGPISFIPGSHISDHGHLQDHPVSMNVDLTAHTTNFPVTMEAFERCIKKAKRGIARQGVVAATGGRGTVLLFFNSTLHYAPRFGAATKRTVFSMVVNPISNPYQNTRRPDHWHHKTLKPVVAATEPDLFSAYRKRALKTRKLARAPGLEPGTLGFGDRSGFSTQPECMARKNVSHVHS